MNKEAKKLFKVILRGMTSSSTGVAYGVSYVVAADPNSAYKMVRDFLDEEDLGFHRDRELESIELIAEDYKYTDTKTILFL